MPPSICIEARHWSAACCMIGASRPPGPLATPHPLLESLLAPFREAAGDSGTPEKTTIGEAACRALVPFREAPIDNCGIELLANGTAPVIAVVSGCGQHVCDVRYYVWYGERTQPYVFDPGGSLVTLEVSPDHRYLLIGEIAYSEEEYPPMPQKGQTARLEFATGRRSVVADCLSPRLSPAQHWYVCRNLRGDVLRFPVGFGPTSTVARAALPVDDEVKIGGPFEDFPAPVEFVAPGRLRYSLYLRNAEEVVEHEAGFVE